MSFPARRTLTARDRVIVRAIAEAMFAQDGEVSSARLDAHVADVDDYVSAASIEVRSGLRLALLVVSLAPLVFFFRLATIARLSIDDRVALLSRLERSRVTLLSLAFIGWRTVMTLVFYEDAAELRNIGYAGEERLRHKRRLPALPLLAAVVPTAAESGVRLRDADAERESGAERPSGAREVA